ncbi:Dpy-30 motif containing protein, putative [Eimeria brunetti]|uniref:Dpy-30 motif containing protein, putative n=1 Tax=Eimeria brunetti TaxID=51314 RepID=U6LYA2_9EIME|nr:Dpy-30 motif containing protein, putative [Eimeria brunetti]
MLRLYRRGTLEMLKVQEEASSSIDGSEDAVEEGLSFGDYLRLRYKNSARRTADASPLLHIWPLQPRLPIVQKPDSLSRDGISLEANHGEEETTPSNSPYSLPLQLHQGYWNIAPSFLSLLFSLVFLDGTHGTPDLRISETGIGTMRIPMVQTAAEGRCWQPCSTSPLPHTLVMPETKRCYKGIDEVFAGLVYQELEEHKTLCIIHKPVNFLCSDPEGQRAGELNSLSTADEYMGRMGTGNECATLGAALEAHASLSCTTPLTILADGQDLTRFHVCLSAPGIQTVVDGISYIHTLVPVDVLGQQPITLKPIPWLENGGVEVCSQQTLPADDNVRRKGRIECAVVASHISPSQWDFLASSDCLVAALATCEKKRLQLATAKHLCDIEQATRDKITALHGEHRELAEEQKKQDGISERGNSFIGLIGTLGSHLSTSKQTGLPVPDIAYLMETVVPVLYPALEAVLRDRPDDPLAYLAFYLLRHSTGYSRTATTL